MAQLEALEARRATAIRYERFNTGIIAAAIINRSLPEGTEPVSPFDFLVGFERDPAEVEREKARKSWQAVTRGKVAGLFGVNEGQAADARRALVKQITQAGIDDAEELVGEIWPT
jgi:hypothetical protein